MSFCCRFKGLAREWRVVSDEWIGSGEWSVASGESERRHRYRPELRRLAPPTNFRAFPRASSTPTRLVPSPAFPRVGHAHPTTLSPAFPEVGHAHPTTTTRHYPDSF